MKTMTCEQMGGPCGYKMTANTPEEMIQEGTKHIEKYHPKIVEEMKKMSPEDNKKWNDSFVKSWEMTSAVG